MTTENWATVVGTAAGLLTVFNLFPQYLKVMKTKHTKDLSKATFISITISALLWLTYGVLKSDNVLIMANTPVLFFSASILFMKLKHG